MSNDTHLLGTRIEIEPGALDSLPLVELARLAHAHGAEITYSAATGGLLIHRRRDLARDDEPEPEEDNDD